MQAQLEAEGFGREMQLAGAGLQAQQAQSALESQSQQRATQLAQLGLSAEQIQSQLQSEGLGRAATAAGQTAQLAQLAGGLQAQQAGLGMDYASLGAGLAGQAQGLSAAQQAQALQAMQAGQGLVAGAQAFKQDDNNLVLVHLLDLTFLNSNYLRHCRQGKLQQRNSNKRNSMALDYLERPQLLAWISCLLRNCNELILLKVWDLALSVDC